MANTSFRHAVVVNDIADFTKKGKMRVKNSLAGETIFGQVQQSEHNIECKVTKNPNQWNLAHMTCYYVEFH